MTATDRPDALARLFCSLTPVTDDPDVHVVVLDNNSARAGETCAALVYAQNTSMAGRCMAVRAPRPRLPLHQARRHLTRVALVLAEQLGGAPVVWMIDDDLTFEEARIDAGTLCRINVARQRIASARGLRDVLPGVSMVVGWFTGDPPVRPEAVLTTQFLDLDAELARIAGAQPNETYHTLPVELAGHDRNEYYYDHAEGERAHMRVRYPWLRRRDSTATARAQLTAMLQAATGIASGCTPFRPLVAASGKRAIPTTAPRRGGNAIFLNLDALARHPYPAFRFDGVWSRRSDMIGSTLLAHSGHAIVELEDALSLHHDRTGQPGISSAPERWMGEFGGVLLARLITRERPAEEDVHRVVSRLARERARVVIETITTAEAAAVAARARLDFPDAWWWADAQCRQAAHACERALTDVLDALHRLDCGKLHAQLESTPLRKAIVRAYRSLATASLGTRREAS